MTLITSILGYSTFGFLARSFGLAIQRRPIFDAQGSVYAVLAFGWIGGFAYHVQERQKELLDRKRAQLAKTREEEDAKWAAKKAAAADAHAI